MIRRIDSLKDFGLYRDFSGDSSTEVPAFNRYNLFYGWNYSGKTTLSRVFQAIEKKEIPEEYERASFRLDLSDGEKITSADPSSALTVRVFNRDYVDANFSQEHTAPAVFIVGEESVALRKRLSQLQGRKLKAESLAESYNKDAAAVEKEIDDLGTDKAREIKEQLGLLNFRRPDLEQCIEEVREAPASHLLDDDTVRARLATLRSGDDLSELSELMSSIPDLGAIVNEVNHLLVQTASNRAIENLKSDPELESWVRQGVKLHQESAVCGFCESPLKEDRLTVLREHFSEAYESLMQDLEKKTEEIRSIAVNPDIPDDKRFMPGLRQSVIKAKGKLEEWQDWVSEIRDQVVAALEKKQRALEKEDKWDPELSRANEGREAIDAINSAINEHNRMIADLGQTRADARSTLEKYFAARHFQENEMEKKESVKILKTLKAQGAIALSERISEQVKEIEGKISQSAIGAEKINKLLKYLLAGSNIEVESVDESEFRFLRDGQVAANLSEGEKTALTLAYFLTSLEADGASPENAIVFVDDPISSLDSNHIYAAYALIVERLEKCLQVFVSTHNSEFFNLLKGQWLGPKGGNGPESSAYWIYREQQSEGSAIANIIDLPPLLRKYKSEYEFVFAKLYAFSRSESPSEHEAFTAPNLLRKFLEAYLGFRKPCERVWHKKLELLFDTPEKCREVQKFADDGSHLQSLARSLQHPDFVESSQKYVQDTLAALEEKDTDHFLSLERVVREAT